MIKNCLNSGDRIFFEIDSIDLWLHTSISLNLGNKRILNGKAEFKFNKSASISKLRKKLQMFAIKLWCHKNTSPSNINGDDDSFSAGNTSQHKTNFGNDNSQFKSKNDVHDESSEFDINMAMDTYSKERTNTDFDKMEGNNTGRSNDLTDEVTN